MSHVALEYAEAHALMFDAFVPVDGAFAAFTHWSFCRATQSLTSLYDAWMNTGAHSFNLLQIAFTSWSHAASGVDAPPPDESLLHATNQTAIPNPESPITRLIMGGSVPTPLGCAPCE